MQFFYGIAPPEEISRSLRTQFLYGTEPHITVKAQSGLTEQEQDVWRSAVKAAVSAFGSFDVELGEIASFCDRVAYLTVRSNRIEELHKVLVNAVNSPRDQMQRYHELGPFTPHLTIRRKKHLDLDDVRNRLQPILPIAPFTVESIWLFRQDVNGKPYSRIEEIGLA